MRGRPSSESSADAEADAEADADNELKLGISEPIAEKLASLTYLEWFGKVKAKRLGSSGSMDTSQFSKKGSWHNYEFTLVHIAFRRKNIKCNL